MNNKLDSTKIRIAIFEILILIISLVIIVRLFSLQIVNGNEYYDLVSEVNVRNVSIDGRRGWIFDRNGKILAQNKSVYDINLYYRSQSIDNLNESLLKLYNIIDNKNNKVISDLDLYLEINPISYGSRIKDNEEEREKWLKEMVVEESDINELITAKDVFEYFKSEKFKINEKYSDAQAYKILEIRYNMLIKGYSSITPLTIAKNVSFETMATIEENKNNILGVSSEEKYIREYMESEYFSNITGFVRSIDPEEYKKLELEGYKMNDLIGKQSLEKSYQSYLRAFDGNKTAVIKRGDYNVEYDVTLEPVDGYDLYSTVDYDIQKTAYESLEKNIEKIVSQKDSKDNHGDAKFASAIMMDVKNGDILAMVSYPSYDANILVQDDDLRIDMISESDDKLFFNQAIQGLYPGASTFKPITAIAALEEGVLDIGEKVLDQGVINIEGMDFYSMEYRKHGIEYGEIDLEEALKYSANVFFYKVGMEAGIDSLDYWASKFGLGEKTGIDIDGEEKGQRNNYEAILKFEPGRVWGRADTAQSSIGQLYNQFTPIQLARYAAALANDGKLIEPRLVKSIKKNDGSLIMELESKYKQIDLNINNIEAVQSGMLAVANAIDGTAASIFDDFPYGRVAAKTGTAETGLEEKGVSSHSLLICYAPYEDPEVAISVVIENGVWGYNSIPVAYDMLIEYFENKDLK